MRRTFLAIRPWLAVSCLLCSAHSLGAATIEGRVVDSAGKPVAGAEVRIWQRFAGADRRSIIRPVEFDGGEVMHTDEEGRFASPDVLDGTASATMIVAEAEGLLAGRSSWLSFAKDVAAVQGPDITLKRLRTVTGQVLDRRGQPVDGATVFNSGDGHERVETTSKGGGKFRLAGVPEGGVFLFAEKSGYRLTGVRLAADQADAKLALTAVDEPAVPLTTLPALLTPDEEYALARQVLDPWLERLAKAGTQQQRRYAYLSLARIDGLEAFQRVDTLFDLDPQSREIFRFNAINSVIEHHVRVPRDELRAMIDSGDNEHKKALQLIRATDEMAVGERATRIEWLEAAVLHARQIDELAGRAWILATVAERLFGLGEIERARQILVEAEDIVKPLIADPTVQGASVRLALAAANVDADRALGWLDKAGLYAGWHGGRVAAKFLPDRPQQAVEVWKRAVQANRTERLSWVNRVGHPLPVQLREYRGAAEFCYHLAMADRVLAEQLAADAENESMRFWQQGAVVLALAETEPDEARRQLTTLVREALPQLRIEDSLILPPWSAPAVAAWLLPLAEKVAPELCRELFWRSLALRLPRPRDHLRGEIESTDIELAKLLGRYDREIARALIEPLIGTTSAAGGERVRTAEPTTASSSFLAAMHIDPRWAKSLLDALGNASPLFGPGEGTRLQFVGVLAVPLPERWDGDGAWPVDYSAGYWAPAAKDQPLLP
jgi:hypothetical protein